MNNDLHYRGYWIVLRRVGDYWRCSVENRAGIVVLKLTGERVFERSLDAFADAEIAIDLMIEQSEFIISVW
jgi:hypothetical protein